MKIFKITILFLTVWQTSIAQGVKFDEELNWQLVQHKAIIERKNIFLDFMATWCVPCKTMDQDVYNQIPVGNTLNSDFISVKVQSDRTATDNAYVKSWYKDAADLIRKYQVNSYPTLLFVTPNGTVLNRNDGTMTPEAFINLANEVKDPTRQNLVLTGLNALLKKTKQLKKFELERNLAKAYIHSLLKEKPQIDIYAKSNLLFLGEYVSPGDTETINFLKINSVRIDSIAGGDYVESVYKRLGIEKYLAPVIFVKGTSTEFTTKEPNWHNIKQNISNEFGPEVASWDVFWAKISWYKGNQRWNALGATNVEYYNRYGISNNLIVHVQVNSVCWNEIFKHATDKQVLLGAAGLMETILKDAPNDVSYLDTYANLLYKAGKTKDAIMWEEKAVRLRPNDPEFQKTLNKMKVGVSTWTDAH